MVEHDIRQHIISASRGNFNDLGMALSDLYNRILAGSERLDAIEGAGYPVIGSVADIWSSAGSVAVSPQNLTSSHAPMALTDAASITPDFDSARHFKLTFAENCTIENPTNATEGQSGLIWLTQGTSDKTVSWGDDWLFVGTPVAATGAGARSCVIYNVTSLFKIFAVMISA